jgi:hypothetical protein
MESGGFDFSVFIYIDGKKGIEGIKSSEFLASN